MRVNMDRILPRRGRLGTLLKYSGFVLYLGHGEPLKILNKDYVYMPYRTTEGREIHLEAVA